MFSHARLPGRALALVVAGALAVACSGGAGGEPSTRPASGGAGQAGGRGGGGGNAGANGGSGGTGLGGSGGLGAGAGGVSGASGAMAGTGSGGVASPGAGDAADAVAPAGDGAASPTGPDGGGVDFAVVPGSGPMPPASWTEHWFEHNQTLALVAHDEHVAIYFDADVPRANATWLLGFMSRLWQYTKNTYGAFGPDGRLFSIHHQGRYSGGHPAYYFDDSHDRRNVSDCGPGPWGEGAVDLPSHEVAHVVESANNGAHGSPGFAVWRDSKWAEIYQYDAYLALGLKADADRLFRRFDAQVDDFPRAGTRWFRNWFFPLWRDHGGARVMVRFFQLLAQHYPKNADGKRYRRDLNLGEFVHFMSGAAGSNLEARATTAFGWTAETAAQFAKARGDFPGVTY